jgi:hypothetical protein
LLVVALVAIGFCLAGAAILLFYREKRIMKLIAKEEDAAFMSAIAGDRFAKDEEEQSKEENAVNDGEIATPEGAAEVAQPDNQSQGE